MNLTSSESERLEEIVIKWVDEYRDQPDFRNLEEYLNYAGYEIHKKGEVEQVKEGETVAAHLRLGDQPWAEQSDGDQGGQRGNQERNLTQKEIAKLRKHMALWPE